jgi:hypothetical protein
MAYPQVYVAPGNLGRLVGARPRDGFDLATCGLGAKLAHPAHAAVWRDLKRSELRQSRMVAHGLSGRKLPPCDEQEPETPPECEYMVSTHSSTYPLVNCQKDGMQLK